MPLNFTSEFLIFSLVFIILSILFGVISKKFLHINGIDFLFFAPWVTGITFGIYEGFVLSVIMSVIHSLIYIRIHHYILLSIPSQIFTVILGYFLGIGGFTISLAIYYLSTTIIVGLLKGIGARYSLFVLINALTNIVALFIYQTF